MQTQICVAQGETFTLGLASSLNGTPLSRRPIRGVAPVARTSHGRRRTISIGARAAVQDSSEESKREAGQQESAINGTLSTRRNVLATASALGAWMFSGKAFAADVSAETMASGFLMFDDSDIPASKFFRIERIDKGVFRLERIEEGVPVGPSSPPPTPKAKAPKLEPPPPPPVEAEVEAKIEAPPKEAPKAEAPKVEAPKAEAPKPEAPKAEPPKVEAKVEAPPAPVPAPAPVPKAGPAPDEIQDDAAKRVLELYKKQQKEAAAAKKSAAPPPAPTPPPAPVVPEVVKAAEPAVEADPKSMEKVGRWAMIAASVGVAGWLLTSASRSSMEDASSARASPSAPTPTPKKPAPKSPTPTSTPVTAATSISPKAAALSTDAQRDALQEMSMAELRSLARSLGLRGDTKMEIINAVIAVSSSPASAAKPAPVVGQPAKSPATLKTIPTVAAFTPPVRKTVQPSEAEMDALFDTLNAKSIAELRAIGREKGVRADTKKELIQEILKASNAPAAPVAKKIQSPATSANGAAVAPKPSAPAPEPEKTTSYTPAGPASKADQDFNADIALKSMAQLRAMARARGIRGDTRKELTTALMEYQAQRHQSPAPKSYTNGAVKTVPQVPYTPSAAPVKASGSLNEDEVERLMEKTMGELRAMARERGVRGDTKKELVELLARK